MALISLISSKVVKNKAFDQFQQILLSEKVNWHQKSKESSENQDSQKIKNAGFKVMPPVEHV